MTPEQEVGITRDVAAFRAGEEALAKKQRTEAEEFEILLVNSPDDPFLFSAEYQAGLQNVRNVFLKKSINVRASFMRMYSLNAGDGLIGQFLIPFTQACVPTVGAIAVAWIHGKLGRKVRIEVGETKVEAETVEEVERLLKLAAQHHEQLRKAKSD